MARWRSAFAQRREAMGFTQEGLAKLLGVDRVTVGRWDRLENPPDAFIQPRLAAALEVTTAELIELLHPEQKPLRVVEVPQKTRQSGPDSVHRIQGAALAFQETDRRLGGGVLLPSVELYLSREIAPLLLDAHSGTAAAGIFSAAASMTEIAGWMTHDSGQNSRARAYFERAFRLAVAAENNALAGNACASMSHLAIELGQHTDALRIATTGITKTSQADGTLRLTARLHAMRARALALTGENQACAESLDTAESLLDQATNEKPADWIANFDEASLASEAAQCFLALAEYAEAEQRATTAIQLRTGDRVRSRAFGQLTMANILIGAGRLDEAAAFGNEVCKVTASLSSTRVLDQLNALGHTLASARSVPEVAHFLATLGALSQVSDAKEGQTATWPV
ncbi:helix-turn-helix transcriptional regulator [Lentzea sp. NPDC042327]|uniref:helix-turn-helix domain-containing protein n=1 Tax=Lentzea sp. NPDC042327 TaxID=3154801 RepID=UPI0033E4D6A7